MPCNCTKPQNSAKKFVHTAPNGQTTTYTSEIQARAAQIRLGGTYQQV